MHSPITPRPIQASENATTITTSTALNISITIPSKDKTIPKPNPHKRRSYRPVQRPDGVITEYPRYKPSPSPSPSLSPSPPLSTKAFQPLEAILRLPAKPISRHLQLQLLREQNLRGVRDFDAELARQEGRDGYNGPVQFGRGGYNAPVERRELYPMDRFMKEDGPWTAFSTAREEGVERLRMGGGV